MSAIDRPAWRSRIEREIAELNALSEQSSEDRKPVALDQTLQGRLSRMDAIQGQAMAQAAEVRRRRRMAALKGALVRLERDEFGECVDCGEPIAEPRLRSDPAATLCIACASASE